MSLCMKCLNHGGFVASLARHQELGALPHLSPGEYVYQPCDCPDARPLSNYGQSPSGIQNSGHAPYGSSRVLRFDPVRGRVLSDEERRDLSSPIYGSGVVAQTQRAMREEVEARLVSIAVGCSPNGPDPWWINREVDALVPAPIHCRECGCHAHNDWIGAESEKQRRIDLQICFHCEYWLGLVALRDVDHIVRVGGWHYKIGDESLYADCKRRGEDTVGLGYSGAEFCIAWKYPRQGRTISHNLWCQGRIPDRFRARLPDNAEFLSESHQELTRLHDEVNQLSHDRSETTEALRAMTARAGKAAGIALAAKQTEAIARARIGDLLGELERAQYLADLRSDVINKALANDGRLEDALEAIRERCLKEADVTGTTYGLARDVLSLVENGRLGPEEPR